MKRDSILREQKVIIQEAKLRYRKLHKLQMQVQNQELMLKKLQLI